MSVVEVAVRFEVSKGVCNILPSAARLARLGMVVRGCGSHSYIKHTHSCVGSEMCTWSLTGVCSRIYVRASQAY